MQKQKGISTLVGIIIIIVVAILLFGGVFAYQYFMTKADIQTQIKNQQQGQNRQTQQIQENVVQQISDDLVIAALNKLNGFQLKKNNQGQYSANAFGGTYYVNMIAKGNLNGDNLQDAVVFSSACGASCGSVFTIAINKNGSLSDVFNVVPDGIILSSASQSSIQKISIDKGVVSIVANNSTLTYKLIGKNLVKF